MKNNKHDCQQCGDVPSAPMGTDGLLSEVVGRLSRANHGLARSRTGRGARHVLPSRDVLTEIVELLRSVLFPGYFGVSELSDESVRFHVGASLNKVLRSLEVQVRRGLCFACDQDTPNCPECELEARRITDSLLGTLPKIREMLASDVRAAFEGDPAATSIDETILCYPGIVAMTSYRIAHELYLRKVPLLPRMIMQHAQAVTGIDIHPGATIGEHFFIDHGTGVVIGETTIIGKNVRLYQGVTLGAKSFPLDGAGNLAKGVARHPIVEDDVIIYSGATILGRITIGRGSIIGGNVWLTRTVPPGSTVTQAQTRQQKFADGAGI